jgi:hypothetical protein
MTQGELMRGWRQSDGQMGSNASYSYNSYSSSIPTPTPIPTPNNNASYSYNSSSSNSYSGRLSIPTPIHHIPTPHTPHTPHTPYMGTHHTHTHNTHISIPMPPKRNIFQSLSAQSTTLMGSNGVGVGVGVGEEEDYDLWFALGMLLTPTPYLNPPSLC